MQNKRRDPHEDNWNRLPEPEGFPPLLVFFVFVLLIVGAVRLLDSWIPK